MNRGQRKRPREHDEEGDPEPPLNLPSKRRSQWNDREVTTEEEDVYAAQIRSLQEECEKEEPNKSFLKTAMQCSLAKRRLWIYSENPSVAEILEQFPPLTLGMRYVSIYIYVCVCVHLLHETIQDLLLFSYKKSLRLLLKMRFRALSRFERHWKIS